MTGIPHEFFVRETPHSFDNVIPDEGHYAVGNVFLSTTDFAAQQATFEEIAKGLGLRTLGWRDVPSDNSILGPASRSKEPKIRQPFVVLESHYGSGKESKDGDFDAKYFERQLYVLRKSATHKIGLAKNFYICPYPFQHHLQRSALACPSLQLFPRSQPRFILFPFRPCPLSILDQHFPILGPSSAYAMGRSQWRNQHCTRKQELDEDEGRSSQVGAIW
jgi:hypothetical protein